MISKIGTAVLGAAAFSSVATAQTLRPGAGEPTREEQRFYARQCGAGHPEVQVDRPLVKRVILLPGNGGPLTVGACIDSLKSGFPVEIDSIAGALAFLAYKPFAPFWPAAEAKWGDGLSLLRNDLYRRADQDVALRGARMESVERETNQVNYLAYRLAEVGYFDDAKVVLSVHLDLLLEAYSQGQHDLELDIIVLGRRHASQISTKSEPGAAADFLGRLISRLLPGSDGATNLNISRARYLAEAERDAEAIEVLTAAYERLQQAHAFDDGRNRTVSLEFASIFACAHSHLGEDLASQRYAALVASAEDILLRSRPRLIFSATSVRLSMYRCMKDPVGYFASWRKADEDILSLNWLEFQQQGGTELSRAGLDWASRPEAQEISRDYRQLPAQYVPALAYYRGD